MMYKQEANQITFHLKNPIKIVKVLHMLETECSVFLPEVTEFIHVSVNFLIFPVGVVSLTHLVCVVQLWKNLDDRCTYSF